MTEHITPMVSPSKPDPIYERAMLMVERGQPNEVLASMSQELSKNFNNSAALELLGHACYQRGEWGLAANIYKQAHCLSPSADILTNLVALAGSLPFTISVSDNDPNKYGIFAAKVESGTATTSLVVNFRVTYQVDEQVG